MHLMNLPWRHLHFYSSIILLACSISLFYTYPTNTCTKTRNNHSENILEVTRSEINLTFMENLTKIEDFKFEIGDANKGMRHFKLETNVKVEDLVLELGGNPLRTLIVSTWRSGSSFLGEMISTIPGTYYHFEPLGHNGDTLQHENRIEMLKDIFNCNFKAQTTDHYFEFLKKTANKRKVFVNKGLLHHCRYNTSLCTDRDFTSKFCALFPYQSMKVVRLRLKSVEDLVKDKGLNVKTILLIRDPRGVMQSRLQVDFCRTSACTTPDTLCAGMVKDYHTAHRFMDKYPGRLTVLRLEDLIMSLDFPKRKAALIQLFRFLGLPQHPAVEEFVQTHTKMDDGDAYAIHRRSKEVPLRWTKTLTFEQVNDIQQVCQDAMDLWGYDMAVNEYHMKHKDFQPIVPYTLGRKLQRANRRRNQEQDDAV